MEVANAPGLRFRLTTTLAMVAGAAVLWLLAPRIDHTERAHGALFLWLLATASTFAGELVNTGEFVGAGFITSLSALTFLAWPAAGTALGTLMVLRPRTWPIPLLGSAQLRSGWDVLALSVLGTLPRALHTVTPGSVGWGTWVAAGALFALVTGFAFFWRRLPPGEKPARAWGPWAAAVAYFVVCVVVLAGSAASSGSAHGLMSSYGPGPLHGDYHFAIELVTDDHFDSGDAEALAARLERLGAEVTIEGQAPQQILLWIEANSSEAVGAALRSRRLRLSLAHEFPTDPFFGALEPGPGGLRAFAGSCERVESELSDVAARRRPVEDLRCDWLLERGTDGSVTYCVERAAIVTNVDVASTSTIADPYSGVPAVMVTLTDAAAQRFEAVTGDHASQVLAVVVDDEVLSAPVIHSAIPGGQVMITLGSRLGPDAAREEAASLASALDRPPITARYEIARLMTWSELDERRTGGRPRPRAHR